MVATAAAFVAGWLLWNVLLVEQDVAGRGGGDVPAPGARP
jgi:hypothetical protein